MAKAKILSKDTTDVEGQIVRFIFVDETEQVLCLKDLDPKIFVNLAMHGASQKVGDSAAGAGAQSDPVAYAKEQISAVLATLREGKWTTRTPGAAKSNLVVEALAQIRGTDVETMRAFYNELTDDQKKGVRANKQVKSVVSEIRAARDKKAADDSDESLESIFGE